MFQIMFARARPQHRCAAFIRHNSASPLHSTPPTEHKVVLDQGTLYLGPELAKALGWKPELGQESFNLTLRGWEPTYFTVTATGSDSDLLSRSTVESSDNPSVQGVLEYLKDR